MLLNGLVFFSTGEVVMSEFGKFIRERREELGISLRGFAKQIGVSGAYISKMERGMDSAPEPGKIIKMAEILQTDPDILLALAQKMDPKVRDILQNNPGMPAFLRTASDKNITLEELEKALARVVADRDKQGDRDGHE